MVAMLTTLNEAVRSGIGVSVIVENPAASWSRCGQSSPGFQSVELFTPPGAGNRHLIPLRLQDGFDYGCPASISQ